MYVVFKSFIPALFFWASTSLAAGQSSYWITQIWIQVGDTKIIIIIFFEGVKLRLHETIRCSGRLEIKLNGTWRSVCLEDFNMVTARVVCKELGCGAALGIYNMPSIANETEKIRLICPDGETPFDQCLQLHTCSGYSDDAAVECSGKMLFIISQRFGGPNQFFFSV